MRAATALFVVWISTMVIERVGSMKIAALNGLGQPVDWWFVLKLPQQVVNEKGGATTVHCNCSSTCGKKNNVRGSGLCYLYADSTTPELKYYHELSYDCLGQGKNDPLSRTLQQFETFQNASHWGYFNDQFYGLAHEQNKSRQCSEYSSFNAHSKGAFQYDSNDGGFYLQSSIPNYPDPSAAPAFIPLGCQADDNVLYAQHVFAVSINATEMEKLGQVLRSAEICSFNFYSTIDRVFAESLISQSLQYPDDMTRNSSIYQAFVAAPTVSTTAQTQIFTAFNQFPIEIISKSKHTHVPPWALVAATFQIDLSVASWWDGAYGIPSICARDNYRSSQESFCLVDQAQQMHLSATGDALYNVENLIQARLPNTRLKWNLFGGQGPARNHGKWGFETPRNRSNATTVVFGDMNMQGFPCSKTCHGSQFGRGGVFLSIQNAKLWHSLARKLITNVCSCKPSFSDSFVQNRMCHHGCQHRISSVPSNELPVLTMQSTTFWQKDEILIKSID